MSVPLDDFVVGEWLVKPDMNEVSRHGRSAHMRPQLMDLLIYLARNTGRTVPRDELLAHVWPGQPFVTDTALPRCIAELRQALGDRAIQSTVIQTIPKRGYRLIATVASPADAAPVAAMPVAAARAVIDDVCAPSERSSQQPTPLARPTRDLPPERLLPGWLVRVRRLAARAWPPFRSRAI